MESVLQLDLFGADGYRKRVRKKPQPKPIEVQALELLRQAAGMLAVKERERAMYDAGVDPVHDVSTCTHPQDVMNLLYPVMGGLDREALAVVTLDTRNRVISSPIVYMGNVNTSVLRVAEMFRPAILDNAPAMVVVHNHPSGDPTPSSEDVAITRVLVEAGKLLNVDVLDHVVIAAPFKWASLKERRLGFY